MAAVVSRGLALLELGMGGAVPVGIDAIAEARIAGGVPAKLQTDHSSTAMHVLSRTAGSVLFPAF